MAQYYFDVYTVNSSTTYSNRRASTSPPSSGSSSSTARIYRSSYSWSSSQGFFGTGSSLSLADGGTMWQVGNTSVSFIEVLNFDGTLYHYRIEQMELCDSSTTHSPGNFIETIIGDENEYPSYGVSGNRFYIRRDPLVTFPDLKLRVGGQLRTGENGWCRINNQLREIDKMWVRINGELKEL